MTKSVERDFLQNDLAKWLLSAIESHSPYEWIQSTLVSKFGLPDDEAHVTQERAHDGVLGAISGSRKNMPDSKTDQIGHAAFNLVWSTFNQNSFFDRRRSPNRKWLDWKEQQTYQTPNRLCERPLMAVGTRSVSLNIRHLNSPFLEGLLF